MADSSYIESMSVRDDPTLNPAFSGANRLARLLWGVCRVLLYRPSPRPFHAWRAMLLRTFGAKVGARCFLSGSSVGSVEFAL